MAEIIRRLRGIVGSGFIASVLGAILGTLLGITGMIIEPNNYGWGNVLTSTVIFGSFGLLCGTGFALLLTTSSGRLRLNQVTRSRVALLGVLAGILPTLLLFLGGVPDFMSIGEVLLPVFVGGGLGGFMATGFVEIARRGQSRLVPGQPVLEEQTPSDPQGALVPLNRRASSANR